MFIRLPVQLVMSRVVTPAGQQIDMVDDTVTYLDPMKIDTFTRLTDARRVDTTVPRNAVTVIRYLDHVVGFRIFYVKDRAEWISRALYQLGMGVDPGSIEFGKIPDGF